MIEYKSYIGAIDFDPEIDLFHGTVINTNDVITFYGASVSDLREEMQKSIEGYLEFCTEQGITPEKPFSGEFTIQMSPEMHCKLALNAERLNLDFNVYLQEVLEKAVFSLEKYLLKSNVASGKAEYNARIALEGKAKSDSSKSDSINSKVNRSDNKTNNELTQKEAKDISTLITLLGTDVWATTMVRDSACQEFRELCESKYSEKVYKAFYKNTADIINLIIQKEWELYLKFRKVNSLFGAGFFLGYRGVLKVERPFGLIFSGKYSLKVMVRIMEEEAEQLRHRHGCEFCRIHKYKTVDFVYYDIPDDIMDLFPVLEFAYKKHSGS